MKICCERPNCKRGEKGGGVEFDGAVAPVTTPGAGQLQSMGGLLFLQCGWLQFEGSDGQPHYVCDVCITPLKGVMGLVKSMDIFGGAIDPGEADKDDDSGGLFGGIMSRFFKNKSAKEKADEKAAAAEKAAMDEKAAELAKLDPNVPPSDRVPKDRKKRWW